MRDFITRCHYPPTILCYYTKTWWPIENLHKIMYAFNSNLFQEITLKLHCNSCKYIQCTVNTAMFIVHSHAHAEIMEKLKQKHSEQPL